MSYRLGMVTLFVQDVAKVKAFYTEVLGMKEVPEFSSPQAALLQLASGTPIIVQSAAMMPPGYVKPAGGTELALETDDVDAAWQDLAAKGVQGLGDITAVGEGRFFRFEDPEGHHLNIYTMHAQTRDVFGKRGIGE